MLAATLKSFLKVCVLTVRLIAENRENNGDYKFQLLLSAKL